MRRGLLAWSRDEMPEALFRGRVAALTAAMRADGLDALFVYTDFTRTAGVARLTHFIPYWGRCVLLVTPEEGAVLIASMSHRMEPWMREVSCIDDLVCTGDIAATAAQRLPEGARAVGVVEMDGFPSDILDAAGAARPEIAWRDATVLFERALGDEPPAPAILDRAAAIAEAGLAAGLAAAGSATSNAVIAAAERACRLAGAEEVLIALAPDTTADPRLRRLEAGVPLGPLFALQISTAYKGTWLRRGVTAATGTPPSWLAVTGDWFADLAAGLDPAAAGPAVQAALAALPGATLEMWRLEGPRGAQPLALMAGSGVTVPDGIPAGGGLTTLTIRLNQPEGTWFAAAPIGRREVASRLVA